MDALKAQLAVKARVRRDGKWVTPPAVSWCRATSSGCASATSCRPTPACGGRRGRGRPVGPDRGVAARHWPSRRGGVLRLDHPPGRDRRPRLRHRRRHLLRQDGRAGPGRADVQPLPAAVLQIGKFLILLALALVRDHRRLDHPRRPVAHDLQFALVLTVAAIPVAMPTVLSVTMAVGARLLAKKQAIVSRLVAVEELAGVDVLCSDKTGTLTQNKLTLGAPFTVGGVRQSRSSWRGPWPRVPTTTTPSTWRCSRGLNDDSVLDPPRGGHFQPFDPVHKRTEASRHGRRRHPVQGHQGRATGDHGAVGQRRRGEAPPWTRRSTDSPHGASAPWAWPEPRATTRGGSSVSCPCSTRRGSTPKRRSPRPRLWASRSRWSPATRWPSPRRPPRRWAWARTSSMPRAWVMSSARSQGQRAMPSRAADGFAQVFPEHKFHIVDVLQKRGHMVGMTGDGVNDAPALKEADCGIAVSDATDAARAAADIVLMTPGLSVIIDAIKESRRIVQRMNSYAIYRIAETLRVLCSSP